MKNNNMKIFIILFLLAFCFSCKVACEADTNIDRTTKITAGMKYNADLHVIVSDDPTNTIEVKLPKVTMSMDLNVNLLASMLLSETAPDPSCKNCDIDDSVPGELTYSANPCYNKDYCVSNIAEVLETNRYNISADLFIYNATVAIAYNILDVYRFDFVTFSLNDTSKCYQSGHFMQGKISGIAFKYGPCVDGLPPTAEWFNVTIAVDDYKAKIFKNGHHQVSVTPQFFGSNGYAGVLIMKGLGNSGKVRNFQITQ